jgi:hypothetical protein
MYKESEIRNYEIIQLYFIVYRNAMKRGLQHKEAKEDAFSAIELRYCISRGTVKNIMSKTKRKDGAMYKTLFKIRLKQLVELLEEVENEIH